MVNQLELSEDSKIFSGDSFDFDKQDRIEECE